MLGKFFNLLKKTIDGDRLPVYVIFTKPMVLISYFDDFLKCKNDIISATKGSKPYFLFQLGWHCETLERVEEIRDSAQHIMLEFPEAQLIFLANSEIEAGLLSSAGLRAEYCNQNAFLDERRYGVYKSDFKYDAIYIARITPFKRHFLAKQIASLKLIGDHSERESRYFIETMKDLGHAKWKRKVYSRNISRAISEARVGLCLSAEEGAMFVSAEYLLSGRPVVTTKNIGGRNSMFDDSYVSFCDDTPESVLDCVNAMINCVKSPESIRRETILKFEIHRSRFKSILQGFCNESGVSRDVEKEWPQFFTHKFGLRCTINPLLSRQRLLKRKTFATALLG